MSIISLLNDKELKASQVLAGVAEIVTKARAAYGNEEAKIPTAAVNTTYGAVDFEHLEDDSKVEIIRAEVMRIKVLAVEAAKDVVGTNVNKEIEKLIATNVFLNNIVSASKFDYL